MAQAHQTAAVLISGGLDSAVLLGDMLRQYASVQPLYVAMGLAWEAVERTHLQRFLAEIACPQLQPLHVLHLPVADLYDHGHWSLSGQEVPDAASADEAVYLPGRNVLLLAKAVIWCQLHRVPVVALGVLKGNPFPDATPDFFKGYQKIVNQGIGGDVRVIRPFAVTSKREVMLLGRALPLHLTFSCIRPVAGEHCGRCNKCAERQRAFADAAMNDATTYAAEGPCTA